MGCLNLCLFVCVCVCMYDMCVGGSGAYVASPVLKTHFCAPRLYFYFLIDIHTKKLYLNPKNPSTLSNNHFQDSHYLQCFILLKTVPIVSDVKPLMGCSIFCFLPACLGGYWALSMVVDWYFSYVLPPRKSQPDHFLQRIRFGQRVLLYSYLTLIPVWDFFNNNPHKDW